MQMWTCEDRTAPFVGVFRRTAERAGYDVRLIAPSSKPPPGFSQLVRHYRHLSVNSAQFELAAIRRWYELSACVADDDRFVICDSDLVTYSDWNSMPTEVRDFDGVVASIGVTDGILEEDISGGFSLWTGRRLRDFCDYMTAYYESGGASALEVHYMDRRRAGNPRAAISDMTLLYRWVQEARIPFCNSNRLFRDKSDRLHYIDHNFRLSEGLGVRFATSLGHKKVRWANGGVELTTRSGEPVVADLLHLVGRCKILAEDLEHLERGYPSGLAWRSAYILAGRITRDMLAKAGIHR